MAYASPVNGWKPNIVIFLLKILALFPPFTQWAIFMYLHRVKYHRADRITQNLAAFMPEITDLKPFIRKFHWHWSCYLAETAVLLNGTTRAQVKKAVTFTNPELIHNHFDAGHRIVLCGAHTAATDWVWQALCIEFEGKELRGVGHKLDSSEHDKLVQDARARYGGKNVWSHEVGRQLVAAKNKPDLVYLVGDVKLKSESNPEKDLLHFLNHRLYMYTATPKLARLMGAHMVYVDIQRTALGRTKATFIDLSPPPKADELAEAQDAYIKAMEDSIRANPAGWWFWNQQLIHPEAGPIAHQRQSEPAN